MIGDSNPLFVNKFANVEAVKESRSAVVKASGFMGPTIAVEDEIVNPTRRVFGRGFISWARNQSGGLTGRDTLAQANGLLV